MPDDKIVILATEPSEDEWKSIRAFKRRATELSENSLVRGGYDHSANFSWKMGEAPLFAVNVMPPEEPFRAMLLTFRHFYANDEPSNFLRVVNIAARHCPDARQFLEGLRAKWNQALFGGLMFLSFNGQSLTANTILELWLNAHYFHNDEEKQEQLNRLSAMMSPDFVKFLLANSVTECSKAVLLMSHALRGLSKH